MIKRALIFENDPRVADLISVHVGKAGFKAVWHSNSAQSLSTFEREQPDLVILDLMPNKLDGIKIGQQIRQQNGRVPILFLASQTNQLDRLLEQEIIATDYLIKPLNGQSLVTRIRALVNRVNALNKNYPPEVSGQTLVFRGISININQKSVQTSEGASRLSGREFDLLMLLASKPGRAFKRKHLLETALQRKRKGSEHTVNTHISRLRHKIEIDPSQPKFIQTVWGVGYKFTG